MKKAIVWMMVLLMSLAVLTGCGDKKSEEQQAMEEIQQHMIEEAAADGVDLQGMLEQEAAESQARTDAREQEREAKQATREDLDAYYSPLLQAEFDAVIESTTPEDTIAHGQKYNELITERFAKDAELGVGCSFAALDSAYIEKAMVLSSEQYHGYDYYGFCGGSSFSDYNDVKILLVYEKDNENAYPGELAFIHEDFSECRLDLAEYFAADVSVMLGEHIGLSAFEILAIENADWNFYLFDITGPEAVLIGKSTDGEEDYMQLLESAIPSEENVGGPSYSNCSEISLEELNRAIIRRNLGEAAESYQNY